MGRKKLDERAHDKEERDEEPTEEGDDPTHGDLDPINRTRMGHQAEAQDPTAQS